jgi:hypothetical protein
MVAMNVRGKWTLASAPALALLPGACGGGEQASPAGPTRTSSPVAGITPTPGPLATFALGSCLLGLSW